MTGRHHSNHQPVANREQRRRAWPKRRAILDATAIDTRLTSGCKAFVQLLCRRSDDTGKPVWGNQKKMAAELGRCDRSIRRYRAELEHLGYLAVYRSPPQRDDNGRWTRRKSNAYYLKLPPRANHPQPAPRRKQRTPFSPLPHRRPGQFTKGGRRLAHLADNDDRSSPLRGATTGASPPTNHSSEASTPGNPPDTAQLDVAKQRFIGMRALLPPRRGRYQTKHRDKP